MHDSATSSEQSWGCTVYIDRWLILDTRIRAALSHVSVWKDHAVSEWGQVRNSHHFSKHPSFIRYERDVAHDNMPVCEAYRVADSIDDIDTP